MRGLPLNALRALAAVYAHQGVRAAAREIGVAHSAVSRHLTELARWLGTPLVRETRGRDGLRLTAQGEALGRAVLSALRAMEQAVASVREARSAHSVVLSTTPSFAARWLLPRLPRFEVAHPRIELSVVVDQKLTDFRDDTVDLAVRMGRGHWPEVRSEPLMDELLYPVMSPAFWRKAGQPQRPEDLRGLRLLHDRDPQASWELWRRTHGPRGLDVRKGPRFASSDLVLRAATQGQGTALARHRLAVDDLASGALIRPIAGLAVELGQAYWLVLPRGSQSRPAVAAVIRWLKREGQLQR